MESFFVAESVLLRGSQVVVPAALQGEVLQLIHEGHLGVARSKARARESVWWPGISRRIKDLVENCQQCAMVRQQRAKPMIQSPTPQLPWQQVGADLFHFEGQDFLCVVDYYSRYIEVLTLRGTSSSAVINNKRRKNNEISPRRPATVTAGHPALPATGPDPSKLTWLEG